MCEEILQANEQMIDGERWRSIPGFPDYAVSDKGNVKRATTLTGKRIDRLMRPFIGVRGHRCVVLSERGKRTLRRVGILVATAFIPNPHGRRIVLHKDLNPLNDYADNLKWVTMGEFMDATNLGHRISEGRKIPVVATDIVTCTQRTFPSLIDAVAWLKVLCGEKNAAPSHICECCRGRIKTAYGYEWSYAEEDES